MNRCLHKDPFKLTNFATSYDEGYPHDQLVSYAAVILPEPDVRAIIQKALIAPTLSLVVSLHIILNTILSVKVVFSRL